VLLEGDRPDRPADVPRWELYRLLADPVRVRLLALVAEEELAVGELAEVLGEAQPKVSRHGAALRDAGLVGARKHGTWVLLRLAPGIDADPVVSDAVRTGRKLVEADGSLVRAMEIVRGRDARAREFFSRASGSGASEAPSEIGAYLAALAPLFERRALAVDAGTGDGALLEVLGPVFDRVVAVDRSGAQLRLARSRAAQQALGNVHFVQAELGSPEMAQAVRGVRAEGADLVFASRVLHHAPQPARAVASLAELLRPAGGGAAGGALVVLDYAQHDDASLREAQADLWLGFSEDELVGFAREARLTDVAVRPIPPTLVGSGPDRHVRWQVLVGRRG
jgi:ArsR family transcriptional regulator